MVGVDIVLVGDLVVMIVFGYDSMVFVMVDEMFMFMKVVCCGFMILLFVGDLFFGLYEVLDEFVIVIVLCFVKEVGCDLVKIECGGIIVECVWVFV